MEFYCKIYFFFSLSLWKFASKQSFTWASSCPRLWGVSSSRVSLKRFLFSNMILSAETWSEAFWIKVLTLGPAKASGWFPRQDWQSSQNSHQTFRGLLTRDRWLVRISKHCKNAKLPWHHKLWVFEGYIWHGIKRNMTWLLLLLFSMLLFSLLLFFSYLREEEKRIKSAGICCWSSTFTKSPTLTWWWWWWRWWRWWWWWWWLWRILNLVWKGAV